MATAATAVHDRAFEEASIRWVVSNVDGDQALFLNLPVGFGDCALMECSAVVSGIATLLASSELHGPMFQLFDAEGTAIPVDVAFGDRWQRHLGDGVIARAGPDQVQFWREQEPLRVVFEEIDTNVTPTGDLTVMAKVRRLRPALSAEPVSQPRFILVQPSDTEGRMGEWPA